MFRASTLNVHGDVDYNNFAIALNADDIDEAIAFRKLQQQLRQNGYNHPRIQGGTFLSNKYLNTIDAVTKELPHSNAAALKARTKAECLTHYLGFLAFFLSLAINDKSSFLLQIFAGVTINNDAPIESLTDKELAAHAKG